MKSALCLLTCWAFLSPTPAIADVPEEEIVVCVDEAQHLKRKFEALLEAASERDWAAFQSAVGTTVIGYPKFVSLSDGLQSNEIVFAEWADIANPEKQAVKLEIWEPVFDQSQANHRAFRAFFSRISRSHWDVKSSASQKISIDYLVYGYGCDLFMIQETKFPYLEQRSNHG